MDLYHQQEKHRAEVAETPLSSSSSPAASSPSSSSTSPSHEFSFTISLHSSDQKTKSASATSTPPFAIDLSPADEIFFHGHLLPLQFLSHLPISPRVSTNTLDREFLDEHKQQQNPENICSNSKSYQVDHDESSKEKKSAKSLTQQIFRFKRWQKGCESENKEKRSEEDEKRNRKKLRFELNQVIKKYARMVRPLLRFRGKPEGLKFSDHKKDYDSFSGDSSLMRGGRREDYSAPASTRTSPRNSGLLVTAASLPSSTSNSTMEEFIQAAIAHCKNSIAVEDKLH